jgi:hypothetical protein
VDECKPLPPGELLQVASDVRALLGDDALLNRVAATAFRDYNKVCAPGVWGRWPVGFCALWTVCGSFRKLLLVTSKSVSPCHASSHVY